MVSDGPYASLHLAPEENHTSTPPLCVLQARCPSCRPTNSVKALKEIQSTEGNNQDNCNQGNAIWTPFRCECVATVGKLFTPMCSCHQATFGTSESWATNRHIMQCPALDSYTDVQYTFTLSIAGTAGQITDDDDDHHAMSSCGLGRTPRFFNVQLQLSATLGHFTFHWDQSVKL